MLKYFDFCDRFRLFTPLLLLGFLAIALLIQGCAKPKCDCGDCNKVASGQCLFCTDHNCTPVGTTPCCEDCNCQ